MICIITEGKIGHIFLRIESSQLKKRSFGLNFIEEIRLIPMRLQHAYVEFLKPLYVITYNCDWQIENSCHQYVCLRFKRFLRLYETCMIRQGHFWAWLLHPNETPQEWITCKENQRNKSTLKLHWSDHATSSHLDLPCPTPPGQQHALWCPSVVDQGQAAML